MVNGVAVQPESRRGVQELRLEECTKREELRCRAERQELMSEESGVERVDEWYERHRHCVGSGRTPRR